MFKTTTIVSGVVSGFMLMTASFAAPAKAADFPLDAALGIVDLLLGDVEPQIAPVRYNDYRPGGYGYNQYDRLPIRKITRKLRRRDLYPVSRFRLRRGRIIVRAENYRGVRFRVVANARSGNIIKIRRINRNRGWQPAPSYGWDDYREPSYDDHWTQQRPRLRQHRLERKPVKRLRNKRRSRNNRVVDHPRRKARPYDNARRQARRVEKRRRHARPPRLEIRHGGSTAHQLSEEYRIWKYGSGK